MLGNDEGLEDEEGSLDGPRLLSCGEVEGLLVGIDEGLPLGCEEVIEGLLVGMDERLPLGDNEGSEDKLFGGLSLGNSGVMASHCA